jgi:tRNA(Ile)-lysidine synthase TilS/MesJ
MTVAACHEQGISFWSDPHNENEDFTRVRVRKNLLPLMESELGPGVTDALARTARILREDADALDQIADEFRGHPSRSSGRRASRLAGRGACASPSSGNL